MSHFMYLITRTKLNEYFHISTASIDNDFLPYYET